METNNVILEAYKKGYRVKENGVVVSPNGFEPKPINHCGYLRINMRINGKHSYFRIHRLQAYQKFGDKVFNDGIVVRHLNGNPKDNSKDNISIGSHSDNMMDISVDIRLKKAIHASSHIKVHNHEDIIDYYNSVKSYKQTMNKYNISSKGTLAYILKKNK